MTFDLDQLTETFTAHEAFAPDADEVLARSREIARNLKRRQWAVRATGSAMLGSAVVIGGVGVPRLLDHPGHDAVVSPASGGGATSSEASPAPSHTTDQEFTAFFDAGYTYDDAVALARIWHEPSGPGAIDNVKAEAGGKLLAGESLPVEPSGTPATAEEKAMEAFWHAGYDYQDAQRLATMWHETDLSKVKAEAGRKLENGQPLPIQPSGGSTAAPADRNESAAAMAFWDAGYTYDDAVQLAKTWHTTDAYQAKVVAGKKIERGESLPISP